jgi:hypothetical protein
MHSVVDYLESLAPKGGCQHPSQSPPTLRVNKGFFYRLPVRIGALELNSRAIVVRKIHKISDISAAIFVSG